MKQLFILALVLWPAFAVPQTSVAALEKRLEALQVAVAAHPTPQVKAEYLAVRRAYWKALRESL